LAHTGGRVKRRSKKKSPGLRDGKKPAVAIRKQSANAGTYHSMTPYFRSYAANFNRVRLLEMIDYREPTPQRREMLRSSIDSAFDTQFHAEACARETKSRSAARPE
jgi:hypothetical protein